MATPDNLRPGTCRFRVFFRSAAFFSRSVVVIATVHDQGWVYLNQGQRGDQWHVYEQSSRAVGFAEKGKYV